MNRSSGFIAIVFYVAWNLIAWFISEPQDGYDTYRYFQPLSEPLNPGITVNVVYLTLSSGQLITLAQVLLASAAWSFFALAILIRLNWRPVAWIMAVVVLLFSLTDPIWSWHLLTYSESLTNSALTFWLASIVWLAAKPNNALKALTPLTISAILVALTRPQLLIFVVPTQLVLLIWWWRRSGRSVPALAALLVLTPALAFAAYRVYLVTQIDLFKMRYALNNLVAKNSSFREYALAEMPPCDLIPQALNGPAPWNDTQALGNEALMNNCPSTWVWFRSDAVNLQTWMLARPSQTLMEFATQVQHMILPLGPQVSAMPTVVSQILLNPQQPLLWLFGYLIAGLIFALVVRVRPRFSFLSFLGVGLIVLSIALQLLFVWGADGDSMERHLFPVIPMIAIVLFTFPSLWSTQGRQETKASQ